VFRTTHIRTKLAMALAVPLAALVAVAGFEVLDASAQVDDTRSQTELASSSVGPGSLLIHLQNERNRTSIDLIGLDTDLPVANKDEARPPTDEAAAAFRRELASRGGEIEAAFAPAWEAFADLEDLRADVDSFDGPLDVTNDEFADEVFGRYTDIIETFFDATSGVALAVDDSALRNGVEIVDAATRQGEMRARIVRRLVLGVVTGTSDDPAVAQDVAALFDRAQGFDDDIRTNSTGPYEGVGEPTFVEPGVTSFNEQIEAFLAGDAVDINEILESVKSAPEIGYTALRTRAAGLLTAEADRIEGNALDRQKLFVAIAGGGLLLALIVTWLASRSITRPLRSLRAQAEEMAGSRLPAAVRQILDTPPGDDVVIPDVQPIKVKTRDEVSQVAAALSDVQSSAVDLAVEQAVLRRNISDSYINLGRRNQNLLSRQLDFITELERNETDPDSLEGLFRLDHLATRMRRNAESLLVLAGIEPPRQWAAPVKVADVVRAALGEVEDYQRVIVRHLEPAAVTGAVASDVAHVMAELIENALSFSPPDQSVEVKGRLTTAGYVLAIADNGLGMAAEDVERANRRLAGKESFTVAPSRYLGHYVAGHLASRLGIVVELQDSPAGGITARVEVPMGLLDDDELGRTHAAATPEPVADPVSTGPVAASVTNATTVGGLPRRGERPQPVAAVADDTALDSPAIAPAPTEPVVAPPAPAAEPEPAHAATPAPASAPVPAAAGFGGLAITRPPGPSMHTVAAKNARAGERSEPVTESGLARRVPGAQRPDAAMPSRPVEPLPAEPARSSPEDVYSFLSSFQSGVARGRADAAGDAPNESQEDGR